MKHVRDIWAVLPVKEVDAAKSRLAPCCSPRFRRELARAMLEDILAALAGASGLAGTVIVSIDREVRALAQQCGVRVFEENARDGHTRAVMAAAQRLAGEGRTGMLTVPGDIPGVTASEVSRLLAMHRDAPAFTIVPAHDRRGSNAIVVSPPNAVTLAFGDDSFIPHLAAARCAGIEPAIVPMPGIGLDIDHPNDLARAMRTQTGPRTSALLSARWTEVATAHPATVPTPT